MASRAPSCKHTKRRREHQATGCISALPPPTTRLCSWWAVKNITALVNCIYNCTMVFMPSKAPSSSAQPHSSQEHNCFGQLHNCTTVPMPLKVCCITAVESSWPNILRASANQARSTAYFFGASAKFHCLTISGNE